MADAAVTQDRTATQHDAKLAVRSAFQLGLSLMATYVLGIGVRTIFLPRALEPGDFGIFTAADALGNTVCLAITFGMEPYTQKEVSVRPGHASDFVGGVMVLRFLSLVVLIAGVSVYLALNQQSVPMRLAAVGMIAMWALYHHNSAWGALLTATREVGGLAKINVAIKVVWGIAVIGAVVAGGGVLGVAGAFLFTEVVRAVLLHREVLRHLPVKLGVNWAGTFAAVKKAFPFMLNSISLIYGKLDINMMSHWHMGAQELGWYGVAVQFSGITLALVPLIGGTVMPLFSRAAARSAADLDQVAARTMSTILTFAIAGGFGLALASELVVRGLPGVSFLPAVPALMILCANFVCTYVAITCSMILWSKGRTWTMTGVSVIGLLVNPLLNLVFIRPLAERGAGWAGTGAALATVSTELVIIGLLLILVGKSAFDRRSILQLARTVLVVVAVGLLHMTWLKSLVESPPSWLGAPHGYPSLVARLLIEAAAYVGLAVLIRAINVKETLEFVRGALRARKQPEPAA